MKKEVSKHKPHSNNISKEDVIAIKKKMSEIKSKNTSKSTTQNSIPFLQMYADGTCQVSKNRFSRTIQFFDTNYILADFEEQNSIFAKCCDLINSFDSSVSVQLTFENQNRSQENLLNMIDIPLKDDEYNNIRKEYSCMLKDKLMNGTNGQSCRKFITFTVEADSYSAAKSKLIGIQSDIIKLFKSSIGVNAITLNVTQRLETLFYGLNPGENEKFAFDWNTMIRAGLTPKDFIAPSSLKFSKQFFEINNSFGSVNCLNILAGELPDSVLRDFMDFQNLFCVNIHIKPFDQISALKFIRKKLTNVEQSKIDEQKKASQSGYDPNILPPAIKSYIDDLEQLLDDLQSKNERLFHITISIRNYTDTKKQLMMQNEMIKRICQKNNCNIIPCDYLQEQALFSSLPLGINDFPISREMHTSGIVVFMPFTTKELFQFQEKEATYYGVNSISGNMILANRSNLRNPNGLIFGTPGSGKSFAVKREILDCFLKTNDDIFICDPEGEYYPLVLALNGQLVKISSNSENYINPMDININADFDENPISVKSDFIISLCEIIVGGKYGLEADEKSVIDICVTKIYSKFFENPSIEEMPTLSDLYSSLRAEGEIAIRVANSLEMYVNGSQNLFNHRTNIDLSNRIVCFDVKDLGNQLKKLGMLIVQDNVWNRVSRNREERKCTRYYIDEFHLLLKEEQTAKYSAEMWKRFRKWGGMPTGITQNVKDLLASPEIENIFDNSDFVLMLNQAAGDREILADKFHISAEQLQNVTDSGPGQGLIRYDNIILPFTDTFPTNTTMYRLMTTKPEEQLITTTNKG